MRLTLDFRNLQPPRNSRSHRFTDPAICVSVQSIHIRDRDQFYYFERSQEGSVLQSELRIDTWFALAKSDCQTDFVVAVDVSDNNKMYKPRDEIRMPTEEKLESFRRLVGGARCVGRLKVGDEMSKVCL